MVRLSLDFTIKLDFPEALHFVYNLEASEQGTCVTAVMLRYQNSYHQYIYINIKPVVLKLFTNFSVVP